MTRTQSLSILPAALVTFGTAFAVTVGLLTYLDAMRDATPEPDPIYGYRTPSRWTSAEAWGRCWVISLPVGLMYGAAYYCWATRSRRRVGPG